MYTMEYSGGLLRVRGICFDARLVLIDSAQSFVWQEQSGEFFAPIRGRTVRLIPKAGGFDLAGAKAGEEAFFANYFDLDFNPACVLEACEGCEIARRAVCALPGLRLLRQPVWETLVGFITSANNNVLRIRRLNRALIEDAGGLFPGPQQLLALGEEGLRQRGFGYRAPYLIATARHVLSGFDLEGLKALPYEQAHAQLTSLPGVGDKVAACVQLFALGDRSAFPVDVWVKRAMHAWFGLDNPRALREQALRLFGPQAGLVQQYLFHCARTGLIPCEEAK